ncbi:MAG: hypothetical protein HC913_07980 [Microscillaceae bacterium]|nr:hypothetical protein [Microscillaceae bacterium]
MSKTNPASIAFIAFWLALGFVSGEEAQAQKIPRDSASSLEKLQFIRPHTKLNFVPSQVGDEMYITLVQCNFGTT